MEAVLRQLEHSGGAGIIEEHGAGEARVRYPRLMLWMSLEGDIDGIPRYDRNPYIQFDADHVKREVQVSEGDMWLGSGGNRSGPVGVWQLSELTSDRVTQELLTIVRRSAS